VSECVREKRRIPAAGAAVVVVRTKQSGVETGFSQQTHTNVRQLLQQKQNPRSVNRLTRYVYAAAAGCMHLGDVCACCVYAFV
jgi:hypothetical protein